MNHYLIYAGQCPVCESGLCRVRICGITEGHPHGLVICDDCEAIWMSPDLSGPHYYSDPVHPVSPVDGDAIWSDQNRWATPDDIGQLGWYGQVTIEPPNGDATNQSPEADFSCEADDLHPGC